MTATVQSEPMMTWRSKIVTVVVTFALAMAGLVVVATPASAQTGGYPYANYYGPGSNPAGSYWTDSNGNQYSPYGYNYRNCTDYVAWKLQSLGVADSKTRGLGHGGLWAASASGRSGVTVNTVPAYGAAAVDTSDSYGHVAFVKSVNSNGTITVSEYNRLVNGVPDGAYHERTGSPSALGFSKFVHFGLGNSGGGGGVTAIAYGDSTGGYPRVYSGTSAGKVYQTYWGNADLGTTQLANLS